MSLISFTVALSKMEEENINGQIVCEIMEGEYIFKFGTAKHFNQFKLTL